MGGSGDKTLGAGGKIVAEEDNCTVPVCAEKAAWLAPEINPMLNWGPSVIMAPLQACPLGTRKL